MTYSWSSLIGRLLNPLNFIMARSSVRRLEDQKEQNQRPNQKADHNTQTLQTSRLTFRGMDITEEVVEVVEVEEPTTTTREVAEEAMQQEVVVEVERDPRERTQGGRKTTVTGTGNSHQDQEPIEKSRNGMMITGVIMGSTMTV